MPPNLRHFAVLAAIALGVAAGACASIPPHRKAVDSLTMKGVVRVDESDIEEKIATTESPKFLGLFRGVVYDYELLDVLTLQRDLARIERYYRARGFYDAHARVARVIGADGDHVRVVIVVDEGDPVLVSEVVFHGAEALPAALREAFENAARRPLILGEPFREDALAKGEADGTLVLQDAGYGNAHLVHDVTVDVVTHRANVVLTVDPGGLEVFGPVEIRGLGPIPEGPVRRALDLSPGERYSASALASAERAVLDLGVFSSVEVRPDRASPRARPGVVPIVARVEPAKLRAVRLGVGAELDATKTDVHGIVGWEDHDFFGGLRSYNVSLRPGLVLYPLRIDNWTMPTRLLPELQILNQFRQPGFVEARTSFVVRPELHVFPVLLPNLPHPSDSVAGYLELKTSAGVERMLGSLFASLSYTAQVEKPFSYAGPGDSALRTLVLSFPELVTNLDLTDNRVRPRRGVNIGDSVQVAGGPFGGDAADVRVVPDVRAYFPFGKRVTFAMRASVGFLFPRNYGSALDADGSAQQTADPGRIRDLQVVFFRGFFAGGPNSDRGYPLRSIGPYQVVASPAFGGSASLAACRNAADPDACRIPVGGRTLYETSAEVRFRVTGPLSVATFCDAADVSARLVNLRANHPHLSCGLGGRYDTPVGPVRLDVGYRIPGLQVLSGPDPSEQEPHALFGILPIALAFGIGEAY